MATPRLVVFSRCSIKSITAVSTPQQNWDGRVEWTFCVLVPRPFDAELISASERGTNDLAERGEDTHALVSRLGIIFPNRVSVDEGSTELWVRRGGRFDEHPHLWQEKYAETDFPSEQHDHVVWVIRWAFTATFVQTFKLHLFPLDEQLLRVEVTLTQRGVEFASASAHREWITRYAMRRKSLSAATHAIDVLDATWHASPASVEWDLERVGEQSSSSHPRPPSARRSLEPPHVWHSSFSAFLGAGPASRAAGLRVRRKPFDTLLNVAVPLVLSTGFGILTALGFGYDAGRTGVSLETTTTFFLASMGVREPLLRRCQRCPKSLRSMCLYL